MRNLQSASRVIVPTEVCAAINICIDSDRRGLWIATRYKRLHFVNTDTGKCDVSVDLVDGGHVTRDDDIIGIEYLDEVGVVCIAMRKGDVLTFNIVTLEVLCVGCVSDGICFMSWSPYQDLVVMVTGGDNLLLMTRDFDPLNEVSMYPTEFGKAQSINVGWGKKETQFHGSLGKPSQLVTSQQRIEPVNSNDDNMVRISWKFDGQYFVVSTVEPLTKSRLLRVWSHDLILHSTSEPSDVLGQSLSWSLRGNLIASSQLKPHRHDIIFYEPNGLRHGEFTLPGNRLDWTVREVLWNIDSTILGVWLESNNETLVQLWYCNNYHWYLKQELRPIHNTTPTDSPISLVCIKWDLINSLQLHLMLSNGQYMMYNWKWVISRSNSLSIDNNSTVAVINGVNLLLTPFRQFVVPPPMSHTQHTFASPVSMVTFSPPPATNNFLTLLADGCVAFCLGQGGVAKEPQIIDSFCDNLYQIVWWKENTLLGVASQSRDQSYDQPFIDYIIEFDIKLNEHLIQEKRRVFIDGRVLCLYCNSDIGSVAIECTDGRTYRYLEDGIISEWVSFSGDHVTFTGISCDQIESTCIKEQECLIGLSTKTNQLFIDNTLISSKCTSFNIHDQFIIFITNAHKMEFISRHCNPTNITTSDSDTRNIERGSVIVTSVPHDIRIILQMPRGNLEVITPRPLVLSLVREQLDRINMNLLCDHNMSSFLNNSKLFVQQLNNTSFINLFLSELRDEDVTHSMYPVPSWYGNESSGMGQYESKVNVVCDVVGGALSEVGWGKYILSIITTHLRKSPQEIESILHIIKHLRDNIRDSDVTVDQALKYILIFIDVDQLFDTALGLYDFTLVLTVIENSHKDPKEYLPFLNELRSLPEHYQHYKIDRYLKRHDKALTNISYCMPDKFDECLEFVKEHKLYKMALTIFSDKGSHENHMISKSYGDYLCSKSQYKEAGLMYQRCNELLKAMDCFERCDQWELVFVMSSQLGNTIDTTKNIAKRLSSNLKSRGQYLAAAEILIEYSEDIEGAIETLIVGGAWKKALRYIHLHNKFELIDTSLKPALIDAQKNSLLLLETQRELYRKYCDRYCIIREEKKNKIESIIDGTYVVDEKDADLFSDSSSITGQSIASSSHLSRATRTSAKSAKNRRKAERKKYSLREGSEYEDIALLDAIKDIVTNANKLQDEISQLLTMLCFFDAVNEGNYLQERFSEFLEYINSRLSEIWPPLNRQINHPITGPQSTVNSILDSIKVSSGYTPVVNSEIKPEVMIPPVLCMDMSWKFN